MDTPESRQPVQPSANETTPPRIARRPLLTWRGRVIRRRYLLAALVVIIIAATVGFSLLSVQPHHIEPANQGPAIGKLADPVTLHQQLKGIDETVTITAGPYFLSELLVATITLSNQSHTTYYVFGSCGANIAYTSPRLTGGNKHHISVPALESVAMSCPPTMSNLQPGQTLSETEYVLLTDDGHISLDTSINLGQMNTDPKSQAQTSTNVHYISPSLPITVMDSVPSDRVIGVDEKGAAQITVDAPAAARNHLLTYNSAGCSNIGSMGVGKIMGWTQLPTTTLHNIGCSQHNEYWHYLVGAPGYNFISRTIYSF